MQKDIQDGQSITSNIYDSIPKGLKLVKDFNRNRLVIRSFSVHDIMGLDTTVDFEDGITNMTSLNGMGRTNFLNCLEMARVIITTQGFSDMQPGCLYGNINEKSTMSLTVTTARPMDDGFTMTMDIGFVKQHNDWSDEDYYINTVVWYLYDKDGDRVYYNNGKIPIEDVDDFYYKAMAETRDFLDHGVIQTMNDAMKHLGGMPGDVLGFIGVHDRHDISENIGRLMPWLCVFAEACNNCTVILDDVFDNIHTCVVSHIADTLDSTVRHYPRQIVMSCRRPEALIADASCWAFHHGKAVRISRESATRLYDFDGEGDYTSWIQYVKDYSIFKTIKEMFKESE